MLRTVVPILFTLQLTLLAQWLHQPAVGIPRTKDGKPDLTAPAPRAADGKPDVSGLWQKRARTYSFNIAADLPSEQTQPWAARLYQQRREELGAESPAISCLPWGPRYSASFVSKIVYTPLLMVILQEDMHYRQVFLDGRSHPVDPNPAWMGYSVGHWDGDTLVVETSGYNDRAWLDSTGHPYTGALRVTERFRRRDFGHMDVSVTFDDQATYTRPFTVLIPMELDPDTELLEYVCNEGDSSKEHLVGRASEDRKYEVKVAPDILERYVGAYRIETRFVEITRVGDVLYFNPERTGPQPLIPLSENAFGGASGSRITFTVDATGRVTDYQMVDNDGQVVAVRER